MLSKTKRCISTFLCVALLCTLMVVSAAADTIEYALNEDFEGTPTQFTGGGVVQHFDDMHGKVLKLNNGTAAATASATGLSAAGTDGWVFSMDIYLENTTTEVTISPKGKNVSDEDTTVPVISFKNGKFNANPNNPNYNYTTGWHNVTIYYCYQDGAPLNWVAFLDGVWMRNQGHTITKFTGVDITAGIGGVVYIDNIRLIENVPGSFFAESYYDGTYIYVTTSNVNSTAMSGWSAGAMNGFDGIKLFDEYTGDEVEGVSVVSQTGNRIVLQPLNVLSKGKNYILQLPATLSSFTGVGPKTDISYPIASDKITFTAVNGQYTEVCTDPVGLCDENSAPVTEITSLLAEKTVYADAKLINPLENNAEVLVSVAAYNDFEMTAMDSAEITIPAQSNVVLNDESLDNVGITVDSTGNLTLKVLVLLKTENGYNLISQKTLTNVTDEITVADETLIYEGTATKENRFIVYDVTTADKSTVIHRDVIKSGADKKFEFKFNMPDSYHSGNYNLTVYEYGGAAVDYPIVYINKGEKAAAVAAMKNEPEKIAKILEDSSFLLIDSEVAHLANYSRIASFVKGFIADGGSLTTDNAADIIKKAIYIDEMLSGSIENVFDYAEKLGFADSSIKDFYKKDYVGNEVKSSVTTKLTGYTKETIDTFKKFDDALCEAFVLAVAQYPDGKDNIKEVLNAFSDKIGITKNAADDVYLAIQNKPYADFKDLKTAFDTAKAETETENQGGGSGGGGSTGGGGSGSGGSGGSAGGGASNTVGSAVSSTSISTELKKEETKKPLLTNIFKDVSDNFWGKNAIVALAQKGIINGKGDGCFYPEQSITREEFVKIVIETMDMETAADGGAFSDVDKNEWYYPYIAAAVNNGIINGFENGNFGIGEKISRQDMCVILYRAAVLKEYEFKKVGNASFTDLKNISDYAVESINILSSEKIINGYETGDFRPFNNSTRAECASMIYNFLNLFNKI